MKTTYNKIVVILILFLSLISCKAQQVFPLNSDYEEIPQNSYLKDLNNELAPYIGTYKTTFEGNEIFLYITKQDKKIENSAQKSYYMDALIVKYIVKNSSGNILQDTQNDHTSKIELYSIGTKPTKNEIIFVYSGTNCNVGWGKIILKKLNSNQISWEYRPNDITTTESKCPSTLDTTIYLPETKDLIFTKQ
ncbi:hypothetical protein J2786_002067 [Chryseobacterium vietnamense]|jgi:hypothetical protein|uniref:Uncharacterized protein n=1 Tax=Chryseobacterium vietnamense TaxID=866785 RepID=A0ACC6J7D9_9FLAO|nr:DUF6705 family protein [Chryseobacterium vietnamense]MDR6458960.1 hypothetical protein [Chryseobacterium vietnamense]